MPDYNSMELMVCVASRELEDGVSVGVGTGVPCAATMLAQKTHAPNILIVFEAGGVAPLLPELVRRGPFPQLLLVTPSQGADKPLSLLLGKPLRPPDCLMV